MEIRIGNSMVSSAICEKHARVSFSKTFKINLSVFEKLKSRVNVFPKLHKKSYYYLCIQLRKAYSCTYIECDSEKNRSEFFQDGAKIMSVCRGAM